MMKFLNFMVEQKKSKEPPSIEPISNYKQRLLQVSVWSSEDIAVFEETKKQFNQWQVQEW